MWKRAENKNPPKDKEILIELIRGTVLVGFYHDKSYWHWPTTSKHALGMMGVKRWILLKDVLKLPTEDKK